MGTCSCEADIFGPLTVGETVPEELDFSYFQSNEEKKDEL
jgi:hypothetical protein